MSSKAPSSGSRLGAGKKLAFAGVALVIVLVLLEGLLSFLWLLPDYRRFRDEQPAAAEFKEEFHSAYDPELGWVHVPGKRIEDFYGPGADLTINSEGFRGDEDYLAGKPSGRVRLVCLGDSFTLGYGVGDDDTYAAVLERLEPRLQVVNMGQGGYSIGQDWLWYRRHAAALDADLLLVALIADDIWRMAGERTANGYGKPTFRLEDGEILVGNQPVPEKIETGAPLLERSQALHFFLERSALARTLGKLLPVPAAGPDPQTADELMQVTLAMLDDLAEEARANGRGFAIVLLPELRELTDPAAAETYTQVAQILTDFTTPRGIPFQDLRPTFATQPPATLESLYLDERWHHYSPAGHRLVAEALVGWLGRGEGG